MMSTDDPIAEKGGNNLYGMCRNNLIIMYDIRGLSYKQYSGEVTANWTEIIDGVTPTTGMVTRNIQHSWMKFKYSLDVTCSCVLVNKQKIWTPSVSISISNDFELDWYSRLHGKVTPSVSIGVISAGYDIEYVTEIDYQSTKINDLSQGSFSYSVTIKVKEQLLLMGEASTPFTNIQIGDIVVVSETIKSVATISQVISCP